MTSIPAAAVGLRLSVHGLEVVLGSGRRSAHILKEVSFDVPTGQTVGLVGESGSGKSTLAKTLVGVHRATAGSIIFDGEEVTSAHGEQRRLLRRKIQLIPQDPYSSLDPKRPIGQTLAEAIDPVHARLKEHRPRIIELLTMVALPADAVDRYPHQFSGGQRQRVAIARALAAEPDLIIVDEITSALDVSTQAEILDLFDRLRRELGLTVIFISHNLAVVRQVSDTVLVLFQGELVESGSVADIFAHPAHPYTAELLRSVPGGPGFTLSKERL